MRTTVSISDDDLITYVEDVQSSGDANESSDDVTDAQAIRNVIRRAIELEDRVDELEREIEALEREKQQLLDRRDRLQSIEARMPEKDEVTAIREYQEQGFVGRLKERLF